ncbi:hypothetical protein [Streptomyces sp. 135]|uniref:hypothetical protein n=1 Tax=Streptomyces sp. 135 TaxID=2838850 RepID=UPI001CC151AF|nr:hypothetical protein [Streptomyces sp. 135]
MMTPETLVNLAVFVPVPIVNGWTWGRCEEQFPDAQERIADMAELPRVLRSYGRAVARIVKPVLGFSFNVTAFDSLSGAACGRDQWVWDSEFRVYRPDGDPLVPQMTRARLLVVRRRPAEREPVSEPAKTHLRTVP